MAKMTAPIQEVSRLLDLVPFLSTHSHISLKELAQEFGVTEREMSNELTALSMCGLPGYTPYELIEVFFDSGFVTINNHDALDIPRALTNLELASLLIGLEIMKDALTDSDTRLRERVDSLILELSALVGSSIEVSENPATAHLAQIQRAIASRSQITIEYESSLAGEQRSRDIDPLTIYVENGQTYLNAYCHLAGGYRNFRMDRISKTSESSQQAREHLQGSQALEKELYQLELHGRARAISEFLAIPAHEGTAQLEVEAFSPQWIEKTVVSFAPDLTLSAPATSRQATRAALENILALYRS